MRTVNIRGTKFECSKAEANFCSHVFLLGAGAKGQALNEWIKDAPTPEAKERRAAITSAMGVTLVT